MKQNLPEKETILNIPFRFVHLSIEILYIHSIYEVPVYVSTTSLSEHLILYMSGCKFGLKRLEH